MIDPQTLHLWNSVIAKYPDLEPCYPAWEASIARLCQTFRQGGKLLLCGNGGSAADSEHIVGELMKSFRRPRPVSAAVRRALESTAGSEMGAFLARHLQGALPALSLVSQTALLTACANDLSPDLIFAQQVYGYGRPGDVLLALSTSGNSQNVLCALQVARALELHTIGFAGPTGGAMAPYCDILLRAPADTTADIQEQHQVLYHALCAQLEAELF